MDHAEAHQHNRAYDALDQKTDTRPAIGECRIKSLQWILRLESKRTARTAKRRIVGRFSLLLASIELDNAALQANGHRVGSIVGSKLRQNVRNTALDGRLADRKYIGNLFVPIARRYQP